MIVSFLEAQDFAIAAAQGELVAFLLGAWSELCGCQTLLNALDVGVAGTLAGSLFRLRRS